MQELEDNVGSPLLTPYFTIVPQARGLEEAERPPRARHRHLGLRAWPRAGASSTTSSTACATPDTTVLFVGYQAEGSLGPAAPRGGDRGDRPRGADHGEGRDPADPGPLGARRRRRADRLDQDRADAAEERLPDARRAGRAGRLRRPPPARSSAGPSASPSRTTSRRSELGRGTGAFPVRAPELRGIGRAVALAWVVLRRSVKSFLDARGDVARRRPRLLLPPLVHPARRVGHGPHVDPLRRGGGDGLLPAPPLLRPRNLARGPPRRRGRSSTGRRRPLGSPRPSSSLTSLGLLRRRGGREPPLGDSPPAARLRQRLLARRPGRRLRAGRPRRRDLAPPRARLSPHASSASRGPRVHRRPRRSSTRSSRRPRSAGAPAAAAGIVAGAGLTAPPAGLHGGLRRPRRRREALRHAQRHRRSSSSPPASPGRSSSSASPSPTPSSSATSSSRTTRRRPPRRSPAPLEETTQLLLRLTEAWHAGVSLDASTLAETCSRGRPDDLRSRMKRLDTAGLVEVDGRGRPARAPARHHHALRRRPRRRRGRAARRPDRLRAGLGDPPRALHARRRRGAGRPAGNEPRGRLPPARQATLEDGGQRRAAARAVGDVPGPARRPRRKPTPHTGRWRGRDYGRSRRNGGEAGCRQVRCRLTNRLDAARFSAPTVGL